jgi:hypothetical protein
MAEVTKKDATQGELEQLAALLKEHGIEALVAKHKLQDLRVSFDVDWLQDNALAASFPRTNTAGPHFITLSPLLLKWGLTDGIAFSTIILHELGHVIDRVQNWQKYTSIDSLDHEVLEFQADDFVVACGWKDSLIETLGRSIALGLEHEVQEGMARKRLSRLFDAAF